MCYCLCHCKGTGDWDILCDALGFVVVEGIGALVHRSSPALSGRIRSLISMFNYWKTGLYLGLFLDSFRGTYSVIELPTHYRC